MRINGRFIYLDNHSELNTEKMYQWSTNITLVEIEAGDIENIAYDKEIFVKKIMPSYIQNTHESNTSFCHFGIYSSITCELIGYIDFQNIDMVRRNAELSLSIPEENNRNKCYGFDSFLTALNYAFCIRELKTLVVQTKQENVSVVRMAKKLGIDGKKVKAEIYRKEFNLIKYIIKTVYPRLCRGTEKV